MLIYITLTLRHVSAIVKKSQQSQRDEKCWRYNIGCPNKSARFNFLIKRIIYSKSVDIFISV